MHDIWVPSRFVADAVREIAPDRPISVIPYPAARIAPHAPAKASTRPFTVLTMFNASSGFTRKNPLAAIAAFKLAFGNDQAVRLIVKSSHLAQYPQYRRDIEAAIGLATNIEHAGDVFDAAQLARMFASTDALISLHRSEGFGLTLTEAMQRGIAVVATAWSGNCDFLSIDRGIPVPYRLIAAQDPQGSYHHPDMVWADADITAAAKALGKLRDDPALRGRLGDAAADYAQSAWSSSAFARAVCQHLQMACDS